MLTYVQRRRRLGKYCGEISWVCISQNIFWLTCTSYHSSAIHAFLHLDYWLNYSFYFRSFFLLPREFIHLEVFIHSFIHPFVCPFAHEFIHLEVLIHFITCPMACSFAHEFSHMGVFLDRLFLKPARANSFLSVIFSVTSLTHLLFCLLGDLLTGSLVRLYRICLVLVHSTENEEERVDCICPFSALTSNS